MREPFSTLRATTTNYTFKCHRDSKDIYPVNCLAINPVYGTFATAGGDGLVCSWDKDSRSKLKTYPNAKAIAKNKTFPLGAVLPVVECSYNKTGNIIAVAYGYDWSKGFSGYENIKNEIHVHQCNMNEIKHGGI